MTDCKDKCVERWKIPEAANKSYLRTVRTVDSGLMSFRYLLLGFFVLVVGLPSRFIRSISSRGPLDQFPWLEKGSLYPSGCLYYRERADRFSPSLQPRMQMVAVSARSASCFAFPAEKCRCFRDTEGLGLLNATSRNNKIQICRVF